MSCKQYENTKHKYRIIKLDELKELFDIEDKYKNIMILKKSFRNSQKRNK